MNKKSKTNWPIVVSVIGILLGSPFLLYLYQEHHEKSIEFIAADGMVEDWGNIAPFSLREVSNLMDTVYFFDGENFYYKFRGPMINSFLGNREMDTTFFQSAIRSKWTLFIKNVNKRQVDSLELVTPLTGMYRMGFPNGDFSVGYVNHNIRLGSLRGGDRIALKIWATNSVIDKFISDMKVSWSAGYSNFKIEVIK